MPVNRSLPLIAAAAIALSGCAGLPRAQMLRPEAQPLSGRALGTCESVIYRTATSDADMALRCASVVGAWQ